MKPIRMTGKQVKIVAQLLEWHIENLIDEPEDSARGEECKEAEALFEELFRPTAESSVAPHLDL